MQIMITKLVCLRCQKATVRIDPRTPPKSLACPVCEASPDEAVRAGANNPFRPVEFERITVPVTVDRITVSLPVEIVERVKAAATDHESGTASGVVQAALTAWFADQD